MSQVKNLKIGNTVYGIRDDNTYRSLSAAQRTQLLLDGTYLGESVSTGTIFTSDQGAFERFAIAGGTSTVTNLTVSDSGHTPGVNSRCMAYGNGKFLAADPDEGFMESTDGYTWTRIDSNRYFPDANDCRMTFSNGYFYMVNTNDIRRFFYKSTDGKQWEDIVLPFSYYYDYIQECNGIWFVVDYNDRNAIKYSKDLETWNVISLSKSGGFYNVLYVNGRYFFVYGNDSGYVSETDMSTYVSVPLAGCSHGLSAPYGAYAVAIKNYNSLMYTTDGENWQALDYTIGSDMGGCGCTAEGVGYIIDSMENHRIHLTTDGINWTSQAIGSSIMFSTQCDNGYKLWMTSGYSTSGNSYTLSYEGGFTPHYTLTKLNENVTYTAGTNIQISAQNVISATDTKYTAGTGINISDSNVITGLGMINTATGEGSITLGGSATSSNNAVNIGTVSEATADGGVAYGYEAIASGTGAAALGMRAISAGNYGIAVGPDAQASNDYSTAIGYQAKTTADYAIQLGKGTNNTANTLNVGLSTSKNVQLLNASGNIPVARLAATASDTAKFLRGDGTWQTVDNVNHATNADKATQDASGNVITTTYATKQEVSQLPKFSIKVVTALPTTDISTTTIYLLKTGTESQNMYEEYIYVNNAWEKLGTQRVDLSGYVQTSRTINGHALTQNITLDAEDVHALPDTTFIPTVDDMYDPRSSNAMSGLAVAGALTSKMDDVTGGSNTQLLSIINGNKAWSDIIVVLDEEADSYNTNKIYYIKSLNGCFFWDGTDLVPMGNNNEHIVRRAAGTTSTATTTLSLGTSLTSLDQIIVVNLDMAIVLPGAYSLSSDGSSLVFTETIAAGTNWCVVYVESGSITPPPATNVIHTVSGTTTTTTTQLELGAVVSKDKILYVNVGNTTLLFSTFSISGTKVVLSNAIEAGIAWDVRYFE